MYRLTRSTSAPNRYRRLASESLESRQLLAGSPVITEFMARNDGLREDGNGDSPDWIEIFNADDETVDLSGYRLTDSPTELSRWAFPNVKLAPQQFLVVFASAQDTDDYVDPAGNLHTNFALSADGEYLALVSPEGTVLSEFGSAEFDYPQQKSNHSYGIAQSLNLVRAQSDIDYLVPTDSRVDSVWREPGFAAAAAGFSMGQAAIGYEADPDSRFAFADLIRTAVPARTIGIYSRAEFELDNASLVQKLTLTMRFEDGFVAYLNGVKVAEENAPTNPRWFSAATEARRDRLALDAVEFDISNFAGELRDGINVLAIHGMNQLQDQSDMLLVPELTALVNDPQAEVGFMAAPTPGSANVGATDVVSAFVGRAVVDVDSGFVDAPFDVSISTETPDAVIRYTTNGSAPTATTGVRYTGPIRIDTPTVFRAAAFKPDHGPSDVVTRSYLFLEDVLTQPFDPPGFPSQWAVDADYEMDPRVVNNPAYRDEIIDGLTDIRTVSIVMDVEDLFGKKGIYSNTLRRGPDWERPASVEFINPDGTLAFQSNVGVRIHGNASRKPSLKKYSLRLAFRDRYGPTKLNFPLFSDAPVNRFDNVVLRAGLRGRDPTHLRDAFVRDIARDMGKIDGHATFVHLYLNGLYWGMYNPLERPDAQMAEEYFGGNQDDYDVLDRWSIPAIDGDDGLYQELVDINLRPQPPLTEAYAKLQRFVDLDSFIDYLLLQYYSGNGSEFRVIGNRVGDPQFRFFIWDSEFSFFRLRSAPSIAFAQFLPFMNVLRQHSEFQLRVADRAHQHFCNGGAFTDEVSVERWESRANEISSAVVAEIARWGDVNSRRALTRDQGWQRAIDKMARSALNGRAETLFDALRQDDVYPEIEAPALCHLGGAVANGFELSLDHPNADGIVYYTLDGTDPRQANGQVSPGAVRYEDSPLVISNDSEVNARVFSEGQWSALARADFIVVGPDSPFHLRVSEINYHPHDANPVPGLGEAGAANDAFEFVELVNTGSARADIGGIKISGAVEYSFPVGTTLGPGQHILVVGDEDAFQSRYGDGLNVAGQFEGDLADWGELLHIHNANGRTIQSISYESRDPWPWRANGAGSSLEVIDPLGINDDSSHWRPSSSFGGSPGAADVESAPQLEITELLAHAQSPLIDMIELHNPTDDAADVGGWYVSDTRHDYFRYQMPEGTTIPAHGYHPLSETELGFGFNSWGGEIWLTAISEGKPSRFVEHIVYGASATNISLGPGPDELRTFLPLADRTFGAANSDLKAGDVIISEVHFAPMDVDGDRREIKPDQFEFIELFNRTDAPVDVTGWRLTGGVEFTLPPDTVIPPRETLIVTSFDATDHRKAPIFRLIFGVDTSIPLLGAYDGNLDDSTAVLRLERPDAPPREAPSFTPLLYVDELTYSSQTPWPTDTVGTGKSLSRSSSRAFGNFNTSWTAQRASPGTYAPAGFRPGDANMDGVFDRRDIVQVLQSGMYGTRESATFAEGDWNDDGVFDRLDILAALEAFP